MKNKICLLLGIFLFNVFLILSTSLFLKTDESLASEPKEMINYETNEKTVSYGDIMIKSPNNIVCSWSNSSSLWKDCEVVIEVNNNRKSDLILKGDGLLAKFLKDVRDFKVYTTYSYTLYNDSILNRTCFENLGEEERRVALENKTLCHYNYTRKSFYNFQPTTKLDKIYKNSVIGIKLEFKSLIEAEAGVYLKNQFNFTLLSDYNITLDPDISACSVLNTPGQTYTLTANIINSSSTHCMNIIANNIVLDCRNYLIDGIDAPDTYGVFINRTSATNTNITVRNCNVTGWHTGIYFNNASNNTIANNRAVGNSNFGIRLSYSSNNTIANNTAQGGVYNFHLSHSSNNIITNNTVTGAYTGFHLSSSSNNIMINNTVTGSIGIDLSSSLNNSVTGGSIAFSGTSDYYLSSAGTNNNFTNTNFTASRRIWFGDATSWFNYRNRSDEMYLRTSVSASTTITRTLHRWSQTNMSWNDSTTSGTVTARYNLTGLLPNIQYQVYNFSVLAYTLTTDSAGNLPSFTIFLNTTTRTIQVNTTDTTPPQYSLNSTNSTLAGTPVSHNLNWTDNVGLSGYIFSFDNCTGTFVNDTWVSFGSGTWSNVTKIINSTVGCTIRWCVYANDTFNNWNGTSCLNPFSLITRDGTPPRYSNNQSQLVITYTPTGYSNFSITWTDNSGSISGKYLENNFTGTLQNTSMGGNYPNFFYNSTPLAAGTYRFRFVANDSEGNSNATPVLYFTIARATPILTISGENVTYPTPISITTSETNSVDSDCTYNLYRNNTLIGTGTPSDSMQLAAGTYNYTYNNSACTNFTAGSVSRVIVVGKGATLTRLFLNGTEGNREDYFANRVANFTVTLNVSGKTVKLWTNITGWQTASSTTPLINITNITVVGKYNITGYFEGDENYTASSRTYYVTVNPLVLIVNCEAGGPYSTSSMVLVVGNSSLSDGTPRKSTITVEIRKAGTLQDSKTLTTSNEGRYVTEFLGLSSGTYVANITASAGGETANCQDTFIIQAPSSCDTTKTMNISGFAIDFSTGQPISSGIVYVTVKETGETFSNSFTNGYWFISLSTCLTSGNRYTMAIKIVGSDGRTSFTQVQVRAP